MNNKKKNYRKIKLTQHKLAFKENNSKKSIEKLSKITIKPNHKVIGIVIIIIICLLFGVIGLGTYADLKKSKNHSSANNIDNNYTKKAESQWILILSDINDFSKNSKYYEVLSRLFKENLTITSMYLYRIYFNSGVPDYKSFIVTEHDSHLYLLGTYQLNRIYFDKTTKDITFYYSFWNFYDQSKVINWNILFTEWNHSIYQKMTRIENHIC